MDQHPRHRAARPACVSSAWAYSQARASIWEMWPWFRATVVPALTERRTRRSSDSGAAAAPCFASPAIAPNSAPRRAASVAAAVSSKTAAAKAGLSI